VALWVKPVNIFFSSTVINLKNGNKWKRWGTAGNFKNKLLTFQEQPITFYYEGLLQVNYVKHSSFDFLNRLQFFSLPLQFKPPSPLANPLKEFAMLLKAD
jgi:hypothetical protein